MFKPKLATVQDTDALAQMIRISTNLILANVIQGQNPSLSFLQCRLEASKQFSLALTEDWQ